MMHCILPFGMAKVLGSTSGIHFYTDQSYSHRPDLIVERVYASSFEHEIFYNELSQTSPLDLSPGSLYHIPSSQFYDMFRKEV